MHMYIVIPTLLFTMNYNTQTIISDFCLSYTYNVLILVIWHSLTVIIMSNKKYSTKI